MAENRTSTGHLFKPGQSGNPGGRPKASAHVRALAREQTEAAMSALAEALHATKHVFGGPSDPSIEVPDHPTRIHAAQALLDRGWGKPATADVVAKDDEQTGNETAQYSTDELLQILREKFATKPVGEV